MFVGQKSALANIGYPSHHDTFHDVFCAPRPGEFISEGI
jgi:hypothetical protein